VLVKIVKIEYIVQIRTVIEYIIQLYNKK